MSESELVGLIRSANDHIGGLYGQIISINFAMVAAIYFFLNRAALALRIVAIAVYGIGMFMFWGLMLQEANVKSAALEGLRGMGMEALSPPAARLVSLADGWLGQTTSVFLNAGYWALWAVTLFLIFVWKRPDAET